MLNSKLLILFIIFGSELFIANSQEVKKCNCYMLGTFEDKNGKSVCDKNGVCSCMKNVIGTNCDKCKDGYFGILSGNGCSFCACNSIGAINRNCDQKTGRCQCINGFTGFKCEKCSNLAPLINKKCCECNPDLSKNLNCNEISPYCNCKPNVIGKFCEKCKPNYEFNNKTKSCNKCNYCYELFEEKIKNFEGQIKNITFTIKTTEDLNQKKFKDAIKGLQNLMASLWRALSLKNGASISKLGEIFLVTENLIKRTADLVKKSKISNNQKSKLVKNYTLAKNEVEDLSNIIGATKEFNLINLTNINNLVNELENTAKFMENNLKEVSKNLINLNNLTKKFNTSIYAYDKIIDEGKKINLITNIKVVAKDTENFLKEAKDLKALVLKIKLPYEVLPELQEDHPDLLPRLKELQNQEVILSDLEKRATKVYEFMEKSHLNRTKRLEALIDAKNNQFSKILNKKLEITKKLSSIEEDYAEFLRKLDQQKLNITIISNQISSKLLMELRDSTYKSSEISAELKTMINEIKNIEKHLKDLLEDLNNLLQKHLDNLKILEDFQTKQVDELNFFEENLKKLELELKKYHECEEIYGNSTELMKKLISIINLIDNPELFNELSKKEAILKRDYKILLDINVDDLKDDVRRIEEIVNGLPKSDNYCKQTIV